MNGANSQPEATASRMGFDFDARYCTGCKACQVACKDKHDLEVGRLWRRVYEVSGGEWTQRGAAWSTTTFAYNLSIACNHCAEPICVEVCPSGAMYTREDGVVLVNQDRCLGCGYCAWACPYAAPQMDNRRKVMSKCTLCYDELEKGNPPACVAACPLRVLSLSLADNRTPHPHQAVLPDPGLTRPMLALTPHPAAVQGGQIVNYEETGRTQLSAEAPLLAFTLLAQAAAGLWTMLTLLGAVLDSGERLALLPGMLLALGLLVVGMLASSGHLGHPKRAWRALANLRQSWLSREIFFALSSAVIWAAGAVFLVAWPHRTLPLALSLATGSMTGLVLVYCMARVYALRTLPSWDTPFTMRSFISATLVAGAPLAGALLVFGSAITTHNRETMVQLAGIYSLVLIVLEGVNFQQWAEVNKNLPIAAARPWFLLCLCAAALCAAWVVFFTPSSPTQFQASGILLMISAVFSLAGLGLRRACFYLSFQRAGL